jgi:hypothetical protein
LKYLGCLQLSNADSILASQPTKTIIARVNLSNFLLLLSLNLCFVTEKKKAVEKDFVYIGNDTVPENTEVGPKQLEDEPPGAGVPSYDWLNVT